MQTRSRVLFLVGMAAVAGLAIAIGFHSQRGSDTGLSGADPDATGSGAAVAGDIATADAGPATVVETANAAAGSAETTSNATSPTVPVTDSRNAHTLVRDARRLLEQGHAADAEPLVVRATAAEPENSSAWNVLGRAQLTLGRAIDAEASFKHACAVDSNNAYAHNNLGLLYLQRGMWKEATDALETAVQVKNDVAYFHNNLGLAYERTGRLADAAQAYGRAVELQPEHATARIALTRVTARLSPSLATATAPQPDSIASALVTHVKP